MKIAIIGSKGRLGRALSESFEDKFDIVKIDKMTPIETAKDCDVIIDFSSGENSANTAAWCSKNNKKLIIGATGQTDKQKRKILKASENIPIVMAGNFSVGIARLKRALKEMIKSDVQNISIIEKHHKDKKDRPSGTALEIKDYVKKLINKPVQISAIRGGQEIGTHEIDIYYESEVIRVSHQAFSREAFVRGVELSIERIKNQSRAGLYEFKL